MKKKLLLFSLLFLVISNAVAQKSIVKGRGYFSDPVSKIFLSFRAGEETITDSVDLIKNTFRFHNRLNEPVLGFITVRFEPKEGEEKVRMERLPVYLERGTIRIQITDSLKNARISGSRAHKHFSEINRKEADYREKGNMLRDQYVAFQKAGDREGMVRMREGFDSLTADKNEQLYKKFLTSQPNSPIAMYILNQFAGFDLNLPEIEPIYNGLSGKNKKSASGKAFARRIETARKTSVGAVAMDFTQADTSGIPVSLSSFRGKFVLIDFWASWCGPCRAENPNVVNAFQKYKDKGFTVLGISLDQPGKKQAWLDAIHKDKLSWTQLSDLKGWKNEVSSMYGITAIPQNLLLDPEGKIIAKNIRGEELGKTLEKFIK